MSLHVYTIDQSGFGSPSDIDLGIFRKEIDLDPTLGVATLATPVYSGFERISVAMESALSPAQEARLAAIASEHTGSYRVPDPLAVRIGRHLTPPTPYLTSPPFEYDYRLAAPRLRKTVGARDSGGFVTRWDWTSLDQTGSALEVVVQESHTYTLMGGLVLNRTEVISWLRNDGTPHPESKTRQKWYVSDDAIATANATAKEGEQRRGALIDEGQGALIQWLLANGLGFAEGQAFMASIAAAVQLYIDASDPSLVISAIPNADPAAFPWLDNPNGFDSSFATPVRSGQPLTGVMVSPRTYLMGLLNIYT